MIYVVLQRRSEIGKRKPQLNPGEDKWIKCGMGDGNATGVVVEGVGISDCS